MNNDAIRLPEMSTFQNRPPRPTLVSLYGGQTGLSSGMPSSDAVTGAPARDGVQGRPLGGRGREEGTLYWRPFCHVIIASHRVGGRATRVPVWVSCTTVVPHGYPAKAGSAPQGAILNMRPADRRKKKKELRNVNRDVGETLTFM